MEITTKEYLEETEKHSSEQNKSLIKEYNKKLLDKYPWLTPTNDFTGVKITTKEPGYYSACDDIPDYDYEFTELDQMPNGWRLAFGEQMCEEIHQELVKFNFVNEYRILQIKEKFGGLRWYDNGIPIGKQEFLGELQILTDAENYYANVPKDTDKEYYKYVGKAENGNLIYNHYYIHDKCMVHNIIEKYRDLSYLTCITCGKPAGWISQGWISPYCPNCKNKIIKKTDGKAVFEKINNKQILEKINNKHV